MKKEEELPQEAFRLYYWKILIQFLNLRFNEEVLPSWYLIGTHPYEFLVDNVKIPRTDEQLTIATKSKSNTSIKLFNDQVLVIVTDKDFDDKPLVKKNILGDTIYLVRPEYLIINSNPTQYALYEENIVSYMKQKGFDSDYVMEYFKRNRSPILQARFIGALSQVGNQVLQIKLEKLFEQMKFKVGIENPFSKEYKLQTPSKPAFATRFALSMEKAKEYFKLQKSPSKLKNKLTSKDVDNLTISDAYHSLTIEGYDVTKELLETIKNENNKADDNLRNISAAKGFMRVLSFIKNIIETNFLFTEDLTQELWKELWSPSINAGIFKDKINIYRNHMVSIKGSNSVPPSHEKIHHLLEEFYTQVNDFDNGFHQAIFAHFFYVWIHPHSDGNGRISRFLMNLALVQGKYRWLTIPSEDRKKYFAALERSQLEDDISYFAEYILEKYKENKVS